MKTYREILTERLGIHLGKNPAGSYSFVGSIPVQLGWLNKDGSELSDKEADKVSKASNPGMIAKVRVFKTSDEALKAAKKLGVKEKDIKIGK